MAKYRKKPVVVDAEKWENDGDHLAVSRFKRRFLTAKICLGCGRPMDDHGRIRTLEGWHIVCPGDWIITGGKGEHYPCKPDIFAATYEEVKE